MKLMRLNILIFSAFICASMNCSIGTQRDTCRNNLKAGDVLGPSPDSCEFASITTLFSQKESESIAEFEDRKNATLNFSLLNCIRYYEKLKDCNREENRYIPSIYSKE
ncbi:hypothetical protein Lepto1489_21545 (plasmid) [Leptospira interrogans serovar Bataviae]|uniref:Lipoprotein n=1 Tax=Leptospira interrogans serovar Bataviae TaxID=312175 RepID=A0AAP9WPV8_LEPIR|nr:hypothetical protein Lepto1489_21545 [Leptospira interrogans serovar Bataviae]